MRTLALLDEMALGKGFLGSGMQDTSCIACVNCSQNLQSMNKGRLRGGGSPFVPKRNGWLAIRSRSQRSFPTLNTHLHVGTVVRAKSRQFGRLCGTLRRSCAWHAFFLP